MISNPPSGRSTAMVVPPSSTLTYVHPAPFITTYTASRSHPQSAHKRRPAPLHVWHPHSVPRRPLSSANSSYMRSGASAQASTSEGTDSNNDEVNSVTTSTVSDDSTNSAIGKQPRSSWGPFKSWFPPNQQVSSAPPHDDASSSPAQSNPDISNDSPRWPWNNNGNKDKLSNSKAQDSDGIPSTSQLKSAITDSQRQRKRAQHSDTKPGASFGLDDQPNFVKETEENASLQQRWNQLVQTIVPNKQNLSSTVARIESNESDSSADKDNTSKSENDESKRRGGIFELYRPPSESKKHPPSNGGKPWFTPPWNRESTNSSSNGDPLQNIPTGASPMVNKQPERNLAANSQSTSSESDKDSRIGDSSTDQKDWFTPPWKRRRQQTTENVVSSELPPENDEAETLSLADSPKEETSTSAETTPLAEPEKQIKVTYPSKKPWFQWPGAKRSSDNSSIASDTRAADVPSDNAQSSQTEIVKMRTISSDESDDDEADEPKTSKPIDELKDEDSKKNEVDRKREKLVAASLRSSLESYSIPQRDISQIRQIFGSETFFATDTIPAPGGLLFHGNLRGEPQATVDKLEERLSSRFGDKYTLCLAEGEDQGPVVVVVPSSYHQMSVAARHRVLAIGLGFLTMSTCMSRGLAANILRPRIIQGYGFPETTSLITRFMFTPVGGSTFVALSIVILVFVSQVIRRIVASRYRTKLAMPFILPSYQLGSFGAVVYLVSPAPNRAALFDIAVSSAVAMVIPAMICLVVGLRLSTSFASVFPVPISMVSGSLLMGFLTRLVPNGQILVDYQRSLIGLHPLAIVGANCLTIAALNLLPIRQLDGSRIITAIFGRRAALRAWRVSVLYLLFASSKNPYLIMFLLIVSFGPWQVDRPSRNELTEPDNVRTIVGYLFMLLMIGLLLPYPKSAFFGTL